MDPNRFVLLDEKMAHLDALTSPFRRHLTFWKANVARSVRKQRQPPDEARLTTNEHNRLVYLRWRDRPASEILDWHRQVQADILLTLRGAPDAWFRPRERGAPWPFDLDGHSAAHRVRDIERTLVVKAVG